MTQLPPDRPRSSRLALPMLLLVTLVWGGTFVWMKDAVGAAEAEAAARGLDPDQALTTAILAFLFGRFGMAAIGLPLIAPRLIPVVTGKRSGGAIAWRGGSSLGALLIAGFILQMFALAEVSAPVSAFLTSFYVGFTALILAAKQRRWPHRWTLAGVALASFGAGFIDGPPQVSFGWPEILTLISAAIFAVTILLTDKFTKATSPVAVSWVTFVTVGVTAGLALTLWPIDGVASVWEWCGMLLQLPDYRNALLLCGLLATLGALTLITIFQREVEPVRAAILSFLEPVWAAVWAVFLQGETLGTWLWIGGSALLLGNLLAELAPKRAHSSST
ncbi:MAG: DMT family transporter [Planctomycetota bacterium]